MASPLQAAPAAVVAAASSLPVPANAPVEILLEDISYSIDEGGRWTAVYRTTFRILTARGAETWDSIAADWAPWYQERPVIRLRVITPDAQEHWLAAETIQESSPTDNEGKVYSDRRQLKAPLPAVGVGTIVEEEVVVKETQPSFSAGVVRKVTFGNGVPTRMTRLRLEAPAAAPLKTIVRQLPSVREEKSKADGRLTMVWTQESLPAWADQPDNVPADQAEVPGITLSTAPDWATVAQAYRAVQERQAGPRTAGGLVPEAAPARGDTEKIIDALVRWVAKEIRYTGVEFGEAAIVPHRPAETLTRRYGDCKDLALLLVTLLQDRGIPAELALLRSGYGPDVDPDAPGLGLFDHAIVHVPGAVHPWIDPTERFARYGQLPASDQGRRALLIAAGTKDLVTIPRNPAQDNLLVYDRTVTLASHGLGSQTETVLPSGSLEAAHRSFFAFRDEASRLDWAQGFADSEYRTKVVRDLSVDDAADLAKPFRWSWTLPELTRARTVLQQASLWIRYELLFERLPNILTSRKTIQRQQDVQLPSEFATEIRLVVRPPEGFVATSAAVDRSRALGAGTFTEKVDILADGSVRGVLRFETSGIRLKPAEAEAFRQALADLSDRDPLEIRFEPRTTLLADQGRFREAMDLHRALVQTQPDVPEHRLRYALALDQLGLGQAAREEAQKAVDQHPESDLAWQVLSQVLRADSVGRDLRPGTDWPAARLAQAKAVELAPNDLDRKATWAILNEYNSDGVRYGEGAPINDAVEVYRSLGPEGRDSSETQGNYLYALFYSGQFGQTVEQAAKLTNPPLDVTLAAEALANGVPAALETARKRVNSASDRSDRLREAAGLVMNRQRYPEASALFLASAAGDSNNRSSSMAQLLSKTKVYGPADADRGDPASVLRRLMAYLVVDRKVSDRIRGLYAPEIRSQFGAEGGMSGLQGLGAGLAALRTQGLSSSAVIDLMMQLIQVKIDGGEGGLYRVKLTGPGSDPLIAIVLKDQGDYWLVDSTGDLDGGGPLLAGRLAQGDVKAVRQVLDWIREEAWSGAADDPLTGSAFARFWRKGMNADAETVRLGLLLAYAGSPSSSRWVSEQLKPLWEKEPEGPRRVLLTKGLVQCFGALKQNAALEPLVLSLLKAYPDSTGGRFLASGVLTALGKPEGLDLLTDSTASEPEIATARSEGLMALGRYAEAEVTLQELFSRGEGSTAHYNSAAWNTLFLKNRTDQGIAWAFQAAPNIDQTRSSVLNTLACVLAVGGRLGEAREALVRSMEVDGRTDPDDADRLAQGLIAEEAGLTDLARQLYSSLPEPPNYRGSGNSSYGIAQIHLKALAAGR